VKINWLKDVDIFEISYVNRPAIDKRFIALKMMEYKNVIPFKKTKPLPEATTWDAGAETKKAEVKDLKVMCTWYDSKDTDNKGAYKLPHHTADTGYPVSWNGVKAAMGALMGARGGVMLPESDRKGVYNHLVKHYKQFDKEVPEFKELDDVDKSFINKMADKIKNKLGYVETKIGRVLSKANETKLLNAAASIVKAGETIQTVLASVGKNLKKEGSDMDEKEVKDIVEKAIEKKMGTFKKDIEDKLEELLSKNDEEEEEEIDEDEESEEEEEEEEEDEESEEESDEEDEDNKEKKKKSKKNVSKKKSKNDKLLTDISDIVEKKVNEVKSDVDKIKKELKIKPESDKKKVNRKDSDSEDKNDDDADYTGILGIKDI